MQLSRRMHDSRGWGHQPRRGCVLGWAILMARAHVLVIPELTLEVRLVMTIALELTMDLRRAKVLTMALRLAKVLVWSV